MKPGLQITYGKTQFLGTKYSEKLALETKYGKIELVNEFKYIGEIMQKSGLYIKSNEERVPKSQKTYKLT